MLLLWHSADIRMNSPVATCEWNCTEVPELTPLSKWRRNWMVLFALGFKVLSPVFWRKGVAKTCVETEAFILEEDLCPVMSPSLSPLTPSPFPACRSPSPLSNGTCPPPLLTSPHQWRTAAPWTSWAVPMGSVQTGLWTLSPWSRRHPQRPCQLTTFCLMVMRSRYRSQWHFQISTLSPTNRYGTQIKSLMRFGFIAHFDCTLNCKCAWIIYILLCVKPMYTVYVRITCNKLVLPCLYVFDKL